MIRLNEVIGRNAPFLRQSVDHIDGQGALLFSTSDARGRNPNSVARSPWLRPDRSMWALEHRLLCRL